MWNEDVGKIKLGFSLNDDGMTLVHSTKIRLLVFLFVIFISLIIYGGASLCMRRRYLVARQLPTLRGVTTPHPRNDNSPPSKCDNSPPKKTTTPHPANATSANPYNSNSRPIDLSFFKTIVHTSIANCMLFVVMANSMRKQRNTKPRQATPNNYNEVETCTVILMSEPKHFSSEIVNNFRCGSEILGWLLEFGLFLLFWRLHFLLWRFHNLKSEV